MNPIAIISLAVVVYVFIGTLVGIFVAATCSLPKNSPDSPGSRGAFCGTFWPIAIFFWALFLILIDLEERIERARESK